MHGHSYHSIDHSYVVVCTLCTFKAVKNTTPDAKLDITCKSPNHGVASMQAGEAVASPNFSD